MRMFIHGMKSLVRRPVKTVMLFMILFVVFNLIFTGFIIENSIGKSKDYIRTQMGAAVEYRMDYTSAMTPGSQTQTRPPALSLQVAESIAQSPYVMGYFVAESANANSDTLEPAETQESSQGFQRSFSDFTLSGSNQATPLDFAMGEVKLSEGRLLLESELENGEAKVLVSRDVATTNDLRIGDIVALSPAAAQTGRAPGQATAGTVTTAPASDYEVVGIYEVVSEDFSVNTIFTSNAVITGLSDTAASDDTSASIVYLLDSPDNVQAFKDEVSPLVTSEYHTLYSNDDSYESLTKPLDLLTVITSILIWVVFIAGAAIILAIVTIFVRDRKFEIGLLLSSGEGKMKIVSQFVIEILVIAILAFGVSVGTSRVASGAVSTWIVENQLLSETSIIGSTTDTTVNIRNQMGRNNASESIYGDVDMENVAESFDVSLSLSVMGNLLLVSVILVLIGSTIPLSVIMGYNPKRILQDY